MIGQKQGSSKPDSPSNVISSEGMDKLRNQILSKVPKDHKEEGGLLSEGDIYKYAEDWVQDTNRHGSDKDAIIEGLETLIDTMDIRNYKWAVAIINKVKKMVKDA